MMVFLTLSKEHNLALKTNETQEAGHVNELLAFLCHLMFNLVIHLARATLNRLPYIVQDSLIHPEQV